MSIPQIPANSWTTAPLGELLEILDSQRVPVNAKERETRKGTVPYYGATGQVGWIDDYLFDEELILLGEDGAPFLQSDKQKAFIIRGKSWVNNHAHVLKALGGTPSTFWKYQLDQVQFRQFVSGTTRLKLSQAPMRQIPLLVPPLPEQHRIVEAIESYFTRLDDAVASLERVQKNLKRYRASVLKAAVEGRLVPTEAELARKEGRSYESASELFKRILTERRRRWEESRRKGKYQEPTAPDTSGLPELPEGWCWANAEALSDEERSITYGVVKLGDVVADGIPTLRSSNVRHLSLETEYVKPISSKIAAMYARTSLKGGEVLVTVRGTLGGICAVPPHCRGFNISREVAMIALIEPELAPLVAILIASPPLQNWLMRHTKGIAYTGINIETLKLLPIPVPPLAEGKRIRDTVDRLLSVGDAIKTASTLQLNRCSRIKQAVLKWAFEGKLADQDPKDEPAEVLLRRIKATM